MALEWARDVLVPYEVIVSASSPQLEQWCDGVAMLGIMHYFRNDLVDWRSIQADEAKRNWMLVAKICGELGIDNGIVPTARDFEDNGEYAMELVVQLLTQLQEQDTYFEEEAPGGRVAELEAEVASLKQRLASEEHDVTQSLEEIQESLDEAKQELKVERNIRLEIEHEKNVLEDLLHEKKFPLEQWASMMDQLQDDNRKLQARLEKHKAARRQLTSEVRSYKQDLVDVTHKYFQAKHAKVQPVLEDEVAEMAVVVKIVADRMASLEAELKDLAAKHEFLQARLQVKRKQLRRRLKAEGQAAALVPMQAPQEDCGGVWTPRSTELRAQLHLAQQKLADETANRTVAEKNVARLLSKVASLRDKVTSIECTKEDITQQLEAKERQARKQEALLHAEVNALQQEIDSLRQHTDDSS